MSQQLACPNCGSPDLDTMEVATCISECEGIFEDGPHWNGTTDYERGSQETVGVWCSGCNDWHYEGPDWLTKLVPLSDDRDEVLKNHKWAVDEAVDYILETNQDQPGYDRASALAAFDSIVDEEGGDVSKAIKRIYESSWS